MSEPATLYDRIGVLRPFRHRDFRLLWLGQAISFVGDGIYVVAVAWLVYSDLEGSASDFALIGVAWALPQVLLLLATGALSDRMDRRHLMIAGDAIRFVAIATIGVMTLTGTITLLVLVALVFLYGAGAAVFAPSFNAIVPSLVPPEQLVEANSLGQVVRPAALTVVGPVLGGLLLIPGTGWAFVADALTFVVSAICVAMIRTRPRRDPEEPPARLAADIKEGVGYVRSNPWLFWGLFGAAIALFCVWGPFETLMPLVVKDELGGGEIQLALVWAAGGVGEVVVAVTMGQRSKLPRRPITVLYLAWALSMSMTAAFGVVSEQWQAMLAAFVAEASITVLIVIWYTLMQRLVPGELLGRVSALDWMVSIGLLPLSFAVVGPVADAIGVQATLILAGVLGTLTVFAILAVPGSRGPERDGSLAESSPVSP